MGTPISDAELDAIPGWFQEYDVDLFRFLLAETGRRGAGDLAELGVYLGKSAVVLGESLTPGETLTVVDLFGADAEEGANRAENEDQYAGLTRAAFEANYRRLLPELPQVITGTSDTITQHAAHGTHRFVHVDASHLYEHVVGDIAAARTLLREDGVVVFDDFRSEHTPGVSAAVWQAMRDGLRPFALTPVKLYATFGDADPWFAAVSGWVAGTRWSSEVQTIGEQQVLRLWWEAERTDGTPASAGAQDRGSRLHRAVRRLRG